ncbi:hypothetical protein V6N11_072293 [Hibiscus sabdariffa]|uniref:Transmembrane 9 superfamily member n=1 Tax=Hibiscus sabdariffa TaxID=183260 RepID=A0ABR2U2X3_9ROSI
MFLATAFSIFFILNALIWGQNSSGAVLFGAMFALVTLWFGISVPLVFVATYIGMKKPAIEDPVRTNKIPRQIPKRRSCLTSDSSANIRNFALPVYVDCSLCILRAHQNNWFLCLLLVHKAYLLIIEDRLIFYCNLSKISNLFRHKDTQTIPQAHRLAKVLNLQS